jgi:hypothetical protein
MSRGPGTVQRHILQTLADKQAFDPHAWTTVRELVTTDRRSDEESTRRALRKLAAAGHIETRRTRSRENTSPLIRADRGLWVIEARLPPETDQEAKCCPVDIDATPRQRTIFEERAVIIPWSRRNRRAAKPCGQADWQIPVSDAKTLSWMDATARRLARSQT